MLLLNKRIVVTRQRQKAAEISDLLEEHGGQPILLPTIEISPPTNYADLDQALNHLAEYDWFIFTSANAVAAVWARFAELDIEKIPAAVKTAAIGPKTSRALERRGLVPDFVPQEYVLEEIVPGLGPLEGKRVLMARGILARSVLPQMIREQGGRADDFTAYRTLPAAPDPDSIKALKDGVDMITFTSPSTIDNFAQIAHNSGLAASDLPGSPAFAYIGPITAQRGNSLGLPQDLIAEDYVVEGLVSAILDFYAHREANFA